MRKRVVDENQTDMFTFDKRALLQERAESQARFEEIQARVDEVQDRKHPFFRVRVHPFEKHPSYERRGLTEKQASEYVAKIKPWLQKKPYPVHILVEKSDVVWLLWSWEGRWVEDVLH